MKRVLITGKNSYIGVSFEQYVRAHYSKELVIETIDLIDGSWRKKNFSSYDVVYHVAGLAHSDTGIVSDDIKAQYYAVNTELAIETAKKAEMDGVKQFVFMSTASVYDSSALQGNVITFDTECHPVNVYGKSKLKAEQGIQMLASENFTVTILRPPMVFGKGCKGNYKRLAKIAKKIPVFPDIHNERSMIYIGNLCEFLSQVMIRGEGGVFFPQDAEYIRTSEMVRMIGEINGHRVHLSKMWNWTVKLALCIPGKISRMAQKAFGNLCYEKSMSQYDFQYQVVDFKTSIERTER